MFKRNAKRAAVVTTAAAFTVVVWAAQALAVTHDMFPTP